MIPKFEHLEVSLESKVAEISLNRPDKANALNLKLWHNIKDAFVWADTCPEVRCVVIKGIGKHFCSGIDFELVQQISETFKSNTEGRRQEALRQTIVELQDCFTAIEKCRKPVIAAIHGACYGAGIDLITACDFRYASSDASFSVKEIDLAIVADIGTLQRLPRIVSQGIARELAFTARVVSSQEAWEMNLINRVFSEQKDLELKARECALLIAQKSPLAVRGTKQVMNYSRDHSVAEGLDFVATWNAGMLLNSDLIKAFEGALSRSPVEFED